MATVEPNLEWPSALALQRLSLSEEIITIHDRWISAKQLPSGDIAIKVVHYSPDIVSVAHCRARALGAIPQQLLQLGDSASSG